MASLFPEYIAAPSIAIGPTNIKVRVEDLKHPVSGEWEVLNLCSDSAVGGIERFMITDINKPATSSKAQSQIVVMFDRVSTSPEGYTHISGGSNALFVDRHVYFHRYSICGDAPTNQYVARVLGAFAPARVGSAL